MVKISVVVPVYNNEEFLDKCLSSLCNQTLKDIEIICINDGSSDSSLDILNEYGKKDGRITVISQENQGAGASRNNGIDIAKGEYISFVDGDDWLEQDSLEKLYCNACHNDSDMVLFNAIERKANDETRKRIYISKNDKVDYDNLVFDYTYAKRLVMNSMFVVWSKIYRTSFLKDNNIRFYNLRIFNDMQFHIESMLLSKRISYVPEILYNYNKLNENSLQTSKSNSNKRLLIFDVFDSVRKFLEENNLFDEFYTNFIQFKITESKANLDKTTDEFKEEYYSVMREEFVRMNVDGETLEKIPGHNYSFYIQTLMNESYSDYSASGFKSSGHMIIPVDMEHEDEMKGFTGLGINPERDENSVIVSLTSIPEHIGDVHYCIYSLLNQTLKPHKVILWLAERQFPNRENDLPQKLLDLTKNGLTIEWYRDIGPYKKLVPSLIGYPDCHIATAEDNIFYPQNWLEEMWKAHEDSPNEIIASKAKRISIKNDYLAQYSDWKLIDKCGDASCLNFPINGAGTLFSHDMLSKIVLDEKLFMDLAPDTDDIWYWAMTVLNNVKIRTVENPRFTLSYLNLARKVGSINEFRLGDSDVEDMELKNVLDRFPEILMILCIE